MTSVCNSKDGPWMTKMGTGSPDRVMADILRSTAALDCPSVSGTTTGSVGQLMKTTSSKDKREMKIMNNDEIMTRYFHDWEIQDPGLLLSVADQRNVQGGINLLVRGQPTMHFPISLAQC